MRVFFFISENIFPNLTFVTCLVSRMGIAWNESKYIASTFQILISALEENKRQPIAAK